MYTLWSRGRLLGESELDLVHCISKLRTGFLYPTALGKTLLPVAAAVSSASIAFSEALEIVQSESREATWRRLPEYADYHSACDAFEALELELRDPHGNVISTEYLEVRDTEIVIDLGATPHNTDRQTFTDEESSSLETDDAADLSWRRPRDGCEWTRYQLQVSLVDDSAIP